MSTMPKGNNFIHNKLINITETSKSKLSEKADVAYWPLPIRI